jgi:hypothetical protein
MSTWYHSRQNVFINDPTTEVEEVINELSRHNDTVVDSSELPSSPGKGKSAQRWSTAAIDSSSRSNSRHGFYTSTSSNRSIRLPTEEEDIEDDDDNSNSSSHGEQKAEQQQQETADIPSIHLPLTAVSATTTMLISMEDNENEDVVVVDDLQQLSLTPPPPPTAAVAPAQHSLISNDHFYFEHRSNSTVPTAPVL